MNGTARISGQRHAFQITMNASRVSTVMLPVTAIP